MKTRLFFYEKIENEKYIIRKKYKMKFKLGLIFIVFAGLVTSGIFYVKDYISYDLVKTAGNNSTESKNGFGEENLDAALTNNAYQFYDYSGNPYAKNVIANLLNNKLNSETERYDTLIVHFWASWCGPCVNEVPEIIDFVKKNNSIGVGGSEKKESIKRYKFVIVNLDSDLEDIKKFLKSFTEFDKDPFIRIWDKHSYLAKKYGIDKLPATLVIKNNKPLRKINGAVDWPRVNFLD